MTTQPEPGAFFGIGIIAGTIVWVTVFTAMSYLQEKDLEKIAIQHHAAHYDPQTGDFTWNQ